MRTLAWLGKFGTMTFDTVSWPRGLTVDTCLCSLAMGKLDLANLRSQTGPGQTFDGALIRPVSARTLKNSRSMDGMPMLLRLQRLYQCLLDWLQSLYTCALAVQRASLPLSVCCAFAVSLNICVHTACQ